MPVHGEVRHLNANGDLAIATGVPADRTIIAEDGMVVDLEGGKARIVGKVDAGYIFVDGTTIGDISELSLTDRRILGRRLHLGDRGGEHPCLKDRQRSRHHAASWKTMVCSTTCARSSCLPWKRRCRRVWTTRTGFSR
jgi:hypothetical protein